MIFFFLHGDESKQAYVLIPRIFLFLFFQYFNFGIAPDLDLSYIKETLNLDEVHMGNMMKVWSQWWQSYN